MVPKLQRILIFAVLKKSHFKENRKSIEFWNPQNIARC